MFSPSNVFDVTTFFGSTILPFSRIVLAVSSIESSTSELPTFKPEDFKKVFAMPPPTII